MKLELQEKSKRISLQKRSQIDNDLLPVQIQDAAFGQDGQD